MTKQSITLKNIALLSLSIFLFACGKVNKGDLHWEEINVNGDQLRTILVEEFTGQECPNCPHGAKTLKDFAANYPGRVVTVALHAKYTGKTLPQLQTEIADKYAEKHKIERVLPGIVLNRTKIDGKLYSTNTGAWSGHMLKALNQPVQARIETDKVEIKDRELSLSLSVTPVGDLKQTDLALTVWVVEDIVAFQQEGSKKINDYHHHNVLREEIQAAVTLPETGKVELKARLGEKVTDPKKAKIVAFLTRINESEVLEAKLIPLAESKENPKTKEETPQATPEKDPSSSNSEATKMSLTIGGKPIDASKDIVSTDEHSETARDGRIELSSPFVEIKFPKAMQGKTVTAEVKKLTHIDDPTCGITSVCLESCVALDKMEQNYTTTFTVETDKEYNINVHYSIATNDQAASMPNMPTPFSTLRAASTTPHRVQLTMKEGENELCKLTFGYNPKTQPPKKEELNTEPAPPAVPAPVAPTPQDPSPETLPAPPAEPAPTDPTPAPPAEPAPTDPTPAPPVESAPVKPAPDPIPAPPAPAPIVPAPTPIVPAPTPIVPAPAPAPPVAPIEEQPGERPYRSNVVVIDFTGQGCGYCPEKMDLLAEAKKTLKDNLIVVAMHSSWGFSRPFWTKEAELYGRGVRAYPTLRVNNIQGTNINGYTWAIEQYANKAPIAKSRFDATVVEGDKVKVKFRALGANGETTIEGHPKVNVLYWVLEDNVTGYQARRGSNYNHKHIFRGVLHHDKNYGEYQASPYAWGDTYTLGTTVEDTYPLPKKVNEKNNCTVVAILLDANTHTFLDAVTVKLNETSH